jgi:tetratricopeptide (TPR) repeat protein
LTSRQELTASPLRLKILSSLAPRSLLASLIIASAIFGQLVLSQPVLAEKKGAGLSTEADQPMADPEQTKGAADTGSSAKSDDTTKRTYNEDALKHYNRGVELHSSGFLNQAIAEYRAAIEADDRMEEAWSNLGGIYAAQKSYTKAIEAFQKALILKPDRPTTLNGFGTVLYAKGKIEDAKEKWLQATQVDPKFASAYYNMGTALEYEKKTSEAIRSFVKAIEVNPAMADAFYRVGTIFFKETHWAQAHTMLKKAVELEPDAEWVRDAKKSLNYLDNSFNSEPKEREVKMNVVTPRAPQPEPEPVKAAAPPVEEKAAVEPTKPKKTAAASHKSERKAERKSAHREPSSEPANVQKSAESEPSPTPAAVQKSAESEPTSPSPTTAHKAAESESTPGPAAETEPKSVASSTESSITTEKSSKKFGILPRTKKKEKKEKKADMFVHTDTSEGEPADLKERPDTTN